MKKFLLLFLFSFFLILPVCAKEFKIVHFSDVHLDTKNQDREIRKFAQSKPMLEKAVLKVNNINPDVVVFSGDMVNKPNVQEFDLFLNIVSALKAPFYAALGNHDVGVRGGLTKNIIISKLNQQKPYYYIVKDEFVFIFMDGTTDKIISANGFYSKEELTFLDNTLTMFADKKAIIVQHFPIIEPYKSITHKILNDNEYFQIIDKHKNLIMHLSGHYHYSKKTIRNNVLYISTPAMISYPHAFRYLIVDENDKEIVIKSELIADEEQNLKENKPACSSGKAKKPNDFFEIKLQK